MTDVIFVGGKCYIDTRAEDSKTTPSNYGTYASGGSDDRRQLVSNFTSTMKNNMLKIYTVGGGRSYAQVVPGKFESSGSYEYEIQNGNFFKYVLGAVSAGAQATVDFDGGTITGTPTAALKSYAATQSDVVDSFSMTVYSLSDISTSDIYTRYLGCKVNKLTLKADTDNPFHATIDWLGQKPTTTTGTSTGPTSTVYSDRPYMFYNGQLLMGAGDCGTGTGTLNTMTDSTKAWTVDQWNTNYVVIDSTGKAFPITDGTATTLTVSGTPASGWYSITPLSSFASAQVVTCNSIDADFVNSLEPYWSISNDTGRGTKFLLENERDISLNLDLIFTNAEQLGRFYNGATSATTPTTTSAYTPFMVVLNYKTALSDGDNYRGFRVVFDGIYFDEITMPINPKDVLKQTVRAFAKNCTAYYITNETQ